MNENPTSLLVDIAVQDSRGREVLIVTVSDSVLEPEITARYFEIFESLRPSTPFCMVADIKTIHLKKNGSDLASCQLDTEAMLSDYEPEFGHKPIYHYYLSTLVDTWLSDLAYHWKSVTPPGSDVLAEFGLLERLQGGTTYSEVLIGEDSLY